jgi:hydroxypyruvate reductase
VASKRLAVYVDNAEQSTYVSASDIASTTNYFPNALALAFLAALERRSAAPRVLTLLAASTDGNDGPTDAAGAFASPQIAERARALGVSAAAHLAASDSYRFHDRVGSLLRTGPTNTNVSDVAVLLVR